MLYLIALNTIANVAVVVLALRAAVAFVERRERYALEDRDRLLATIDDLCQRVQAPDLAVIDHQAKQGGIVNPPAVGFDNDEDYWKAAEMTKEQLADELMQAELAGTSGPA